MSVTEPGKPDPTEPDLLDQMKRLQADFENYRKRTERERESWEEQGRRDLILNLLPVFDALEQAAGSPPHPGGVSAYHAGIRAIERRFHETLEAAGAEPMLSLGTAFDPRRHEGVGMEPPHSGYVEGTVCGVLQEGWLYRGDVLRPARVIVTGAAKSPGLDIRV